MFWRPEIAPGVVALLAPIPPPLTSTLALATLQPLSLRRAEDGLHLRLAADRQLLIVGDPTPTQPLGLLIPADAHLHARRRAMDTLLGAARAASPLTAGQRRRLVLALRAFDGRQEGASEREIAEALFSRRESPRGAAWKADALRAETVRLLRTARALVGGAYLKLLRREPPKRRR